MKEDWRSIGGGLEDWRRTGGLEDWKRMGEGLEEDGRRIGGGFDDRCSIDVR